MGLFHSPSPVMAEGKTHLSLVVCGHVDAGKSTTTGHLLFELGGISEREMEKLKEKAAQLGKSSFSFAFYLDTQKDERERGVTISCTTKEFFTDKYHYTIIDAPGHRDFIKNMISGAGQADVAPLMVPADKGGFEKAVAKGNRATGEIEGQTRQHSRLINLLGVEKVIVGINKMDNTSPTPYLQSRFDEIAGEVVVMLKTAGYKEDKIKKEFPFIPISGWEGDNLVKKTEKMAWYKGVDLEIDGNKIHVDTLKDAFNDACFPPKRTDDAAMRTCVSGVYEIKGVGDVITGRVEQGAIKPGEEVIFLPTHTASTACPGKIFTVEMHHKRIEAGMSGDNIGMNVKALNKENMPRVGDVMIYKADGTLSTSTNFSAQLQVLDIPGSIKAGYSPICHVRCGRAACRVVQFNWRMGKDTANEKVEGAVELKTNDAAEVVFVPQQPLVVDTFANCEGLARIAFLDGNSAVMLGKVQAVNIPDMPTK